MLKLSDFFQPLNLVNLTYYFSALLFFDILGIFVKSFLVKDQKIKSETRLIDWLIGLGFFIFFWFLVGFVITPSRTTLLISIGMLFLIALPNYLRNKEYLTYFPLLKRLIIPIILLIPLLPSTFVKASLLPYYGDEMAYHFISPYAVLYQMKVFWTFNGGLYQNVPRLMDTWYILSFAITHTYSVARIIQFSVLATALMTAFLFIKKILGTFSAFLFVLIFLSMPLTLPFTTTIGYVDVPAYCFLLLGFVLGLYFFNTNKNEYLVLSLLFWSMSIGTKYTTLIPFAMFFPSLVFVYFLKYKSFSKLFDKKLIIKILLGIIVFGGYWYIKNFIFYGNPIYPFIFPCWGSFANDCKTGSSFFGTWTSPINLNTFYSVVIKELLPQNLWLHLMLIISPILIILFGDKKNRLLLVLALLPFIGEILILKYFSGFVVRYQQHLEFYLIFIMVLLVSTKFKGFLINCIKYTAILILLISSLINYFQNSRYVNRLRFVNWDEMNYSLGRLSAFDWIKRRYPNTVEAIKWCENPPGGPVALARFDPDMIWYGNDSLIRSYLVNCYYANPDLGVNDINNIVAVAKQRKLRFWTISTNSCILQKEVKSGKELGDSNGNSSEVKSLLQMRQLNNAVVCNSQEVLPNLYYFDYEKLK